MHTTNYNLYNELIDMTKINLDISIIYEIIKKYVANIKLENM